MSFQEIDLRVLGWLNSHHVPGSVPVLQFVSDAATFVSIAMCLIVLFMAWYRKSKPMFHNFIMMAVTLILAALMIQFMKGIIDRERPFLTYPFIIKLSSGGDSSFPSGHSMEAFAMAMLLTMLFRNWRLIIPVYLWAMLIAYSRVALGVHYPSDVLGGVVTGTIIGWLIPVFYKMKWRIKGAAGKTDESND
jgi:undecaprenyl-diphosphatase